MLDDYDAVKETLLESLGDTPSSADRRWWTLNRQSGEDPGAFYLRVRSTGLRWLHGLKTREEICEKVILSRFLSLLPQDCYSSVVAKQPKTGLEASRFVQEFEETRSFSMRHQSWRTNGGRGPSDQSYKREQGSGSSVASSNNGSSGSSNSSNSSTRTSHTQDSTSSSQASGGRGSRPDRQGQGGRKPVTCYGCGEVGHFRPNRSNKVRRVKYPGLWISHGCRW